MGWQDSYAFLEVLQSSANNTKLAISLVATISHGNLRKKCGYMCQIQKPNKNLPYAFLDRIYFVCLQILFQLFFLILKIHSY